MELKLFYTIASIILTFAGYFPYVRDILRGKTDPHLFSWLVWSFATFLVFALQYSAGGGVGSYTTLALACICLAVALLSVRRGKHDITSFDIICFALALFTLPLWLIVDQPTLSMVLLSCIDMLGFLPTIRKSWHNPFSETLSLYTITTLRHGLNVASLETYNLVTVLFPTTWFIANAGFSIMLVWRRSRVKK